MGSDRNRQAGAGSRRALRWRRTAAAAALGAVCACTGAIAQSYGPAQSSELSQSAPSAHPGTGHDADHLTDTTPAIALASAAVAAPANAPTAPSPAASEPGTANAGRAPLSLHASLAALRSRMRPWQSSSSANANGGAMLHQGLNVQVIELPREGAPIGPPPKRAHHALSVGMDGPKQFLRGIGLDATECAGRFRMPSKLGRKGDGSTQVDIAAQLGMACKF